MMGVRAKKKVMNAREKKVTPFVTIYKFVNIFLKVLKLQVGHWNLQVGHRSDPRVIGSPSLLQLNCLMITSVVKEK